MKKTSSEMRARVKLTPRLFIVIALVAGIIVSGMLLGGCNYIAGNISDNLKSPGYPENEETAPTQEQQEEQTTGQESQASQVDEAEAERIFAEYKHDKQGRQAFWTKTLVWSRNCKIIRR